VRDVLASQSLALTPFKVRRIEVNGQLGPGVFAKDVILTIIGHLGIRPAPATPTNTPATSSIA
jgi:3-isopropylmalate/(R)-2-methylmalate dehydratase large subunit